MLIEDVVKIGNGEKSHAISTVTSVFFWCFTASKSTQAAETGDYECSEPLSSEM